MTIVSSLFGGVVGASAAPVDPGVAVEQSDVVVDPAVLANESQDLAPYVNPGVPADKADNVVPFGDPDQPVNSGFGYAHYIANGGRVDIEVFNFYMRPTEARIYATKSEPSVLQGVTWFAVSLIPVAGNYIGALGLLSTTADANFVSNIRRYADVDQCVKVTISKDNFYGTTTRAASYWNGMRSTVKSDTSLDPAYLVNNYATYKY